MTPVDIGKNDIRQLYCSKFILLQTYCTRIQKNYSTFYSSYVCLQSIPTQLDYIYHY